MQLFQQTVTRPGSTGFGDAQRLHSPAARAALFTMICLSGLLTASPVSAQYSAIGEIPPLPAHDSWTDVEARSFHSTSTSAYIGSQSCAASSCHGDPRRETVVGASANYFLDRDKHQLAGTVLRNQRSIDIASRLKLGTHPWQARECLVCHAPGALDVTDTTTLSARIAEGVSCESCHGAARDWLVPHRSVEWSYSDLWPASQRTQLGFIETKSLVSRIDRCADCHVGNATQMVNHDLIAAGHPRLAFEFAAYQSRMPIHWRQANERSRSPVANSLHTWNQSTYEARNWLIGQIVNAEHELDILEQATKSPRSAWPELSQYDCFACHHELSSPSWRQAREAWSLKPGELAWGTWNLGLIAELQPILPGSLTPEVVAGGDQLRKTLRTLSADRSQVQQLVPPLRQALAQSKAQLANSTWSAEELQLIRDTLLSQHKSISKQGWDRSTQLYLASIALEKGSRDAVDINNRLTPARIAQYERLRGLLSFRVKGTSVPPFHHVESPARLESNWQSIQQEFGLLLSPDMGTARAATVNELIPPPPTTSASETD